MTETPLKHYLLASDFDQTLSFKDSGLVLSELLGITGFEERVAGLAKSNLVQQGGELAYLLQHDPEFRRVRKHHLIEAGKHDMSGTHESRKAARWHLAAGEQARCTATASTISPTLGPPRGAFKPQA